MIEEQSKRGGRREGSGRPARHGQPMTQKTVRLPDAWIARLAEEFGSFQVAIEALVQRHFEDT